MKFELFNKETNKVWKTVASRPTQKRLEFELEIHKKLLNFFQVGDFFYLLFNISIADFDYVSPGITNLLGYDPQEFSMALFLEILHPDDRPWMLSYETMASEFLVSLPLEKLMSYKVRYDFRLKHKNGQYIHFLHQSAVVEHDDNGLITRTLCVETDINHLKKTGKSILSFIGMDGEPSYIDIDVKNKFIQSNEVLSRREKDVLLLLIEGKLSKEIGEILFISKQTVDNHRKKYAQQIRGKKYG